MAALSHYLESGILNHIFRSASFEKPSTIAIALTSSVPLSSDDGTTISELPQSVNGQSTNYSRVEVGVPETDGDDLWSESGEDTGILDIFIHYTYQIQTLQNQLQQLLFHNFQIPYFTHQIVYSKVELQILHLILHILVMALSRIKTLLYLVQLLLNGAGYLV